MLGSPVDLSKVDVDAYVIAGIADHLCPWQSCYRTTQLLGGPVKFVLSTSGHIAAMVNPPTNPKATFQTGRLEPTRPTRASSSPLRTPCRELVADYSAWLAERSGGRAQEPAHARPQGLPGADRRAGNLCSRPLRSAASPSAAGSCGSRCGRAGAA